MSGVIIRPCEKHDAFGISRLNEEAFGYDSPPGATADRLEELLNKPNVRLWVAEKDGQVMGYIHAADYDCTYLDPLKNIMALAVAEEFRGEGTGRLLLEAAEGWARDEGCAGLRLVSGMNRKGAHEFYLRCGYRDRKDQKNFIKLFGE